MTRAGQFFRYALVIDGKQENPKCWAFAVVSIRLATLSGALWLALLDCPWPWVALAMGVTMMYWLWRVLAKIIFQQMVNKGWAPQSARRFIGLVFLNLAEVVFAAGVLVAATESLQRGPTFKPQIESFGVALLSAAAPLGSAAATPKTGWAEATSLVGLAMVVFMSVVVIAAAVNGAFAARQQSKGTADDDCW